MISPAFREPDGNIVVRRLELTLFVDQAVTVKDAKSIALHHSTLKPVTTRRGLAGRVNAVAASGAVPSGRRSQKLFLCSRRYGVIADHFNSKWGEL